MYISFDDEIIQLDEDLNRIWDFKIDNLTTYQVIAENKNFIWFSAVKINDFLPFLFHNRQHYEKNSYYIFKISKEKEHEGMIEFKNAKNEFSVESAFSDGPNLVCLSYNNAAYNVLDSNFRSTEYNLFKADTFMAIDWIHQTHNLQNLFLDRYGHTFRKQDNEYHVEVPIFNQITFQDTIIPSEQTDQYVQLTLKTNGKLKEHRVLLEKNLLTKSDTKFVSFIPNYGTLEPVELFNNINLALIEF